MQQHPFLGAGILARNQDSKKAPAKKQSEAARQKPLWIQPSTTIGRIHLTVQTQSGSSL
jgi:hypothetical protein